jgi:ankyrin repeat protein
VPCARYSLGGGRIVRFALNTRLEKALGEAKDGTPIEEFLVKKLWTDDCWQKGEHCAKVHCSAVRWNMVNIVLALIRWKRAVKYGTFLEKEELLAIAVEYGHVELVQHLTEMPDVNVNISVNKIWAVFRCLSLWEPNEKLTDQKKKSSNHHFLFLKPIVSAARMRNVDIVMSLLACDRTDVNKREPLHSAAAMGHVDVVKELLKSEKQVDVNEVKHLPLQLEHDISRYGQTFSPLHLASLFGHANVVQGLCEDTKRRLRANIENLWGNNSPSNCNGDEA